MFHLSCVLCFFSCVACGVWFGGEEGGAGHLVLCVYAHIRTLCNGGYYRYWNVLPCLSPAEVVQHATDMFKLCDTDNTGSVAFDELSVLLAQVRGACPLPPLIDGASFPFLLFPLLFIPWVSQHTHGPANRPLPLSCPMHAISRRLEMTIPYQLMHLYVLPCLVALPPGNSIV